jgi:hypothetical protein
MPLPLRIHTFDSTGDAYDACQTDENIKNGDCLFIPRERVVGLAATWPISVTATAGNLHVVNEGRLQSYTDDIGITRAQVDFAVRVAMRKGWELADALSGDPYED